jgi:uncharacterized protein (TIGR03086 family)
MDLSTLHRTTIDGWRDLVGRIDADQWGLPTPCEDWSVRDLVNHVTGEDLWTVPLVDGSTIEAVGDRFDGDVLGDDPVTTAQDAADAARASVELRLPGGGSVHLSYGDERLEEYVFQLAADHLVHGWDLAVAIGAPSRLDADAVAAVADWFAEREEMYRGGGAIGPRTGTYDDPQDDLVSRFGRDPGWQAP